MVNITLIGDSIFDNKTYVGADGLDVISHLNNNLNAPDKATLCAVDGAVTRGVRSQLKKVPKSATHLFLSVGGNDALGEMDILNAPVQNSLEVFHELSDVALQFEARYITMLKGVLAKNIPTCISTIYYPRYPTKIVQKITTAALASFNDVIIRQAFINRLPLLDLRLLCNDDADYANPIEPSHKGGEKIAKKIMQIASAAENFNQARVFF